MAEQTAGGLTAAERTELETLRAEVAGLRRRLDTSIGDGPNGAVPVRVATGRTRRVWRWVACAMAFTLAGVLAIGSVAARYVRAELLDTDRYVQTVAPIAADPAVQAQVVETATAAIVDALNVEQVTSEALTALADAAPSLPPTISAELPSLAPAIAGGVENLVHQAVTTVVISPKFEDFWVEANRAAHANLVTVLTGQGDTAVRTDAHGDVTLSLAPIIDQVKQQLVDRGLTIAGKLPDINATFTLFQSDQIEGLQRLVRLLDDVATALPWIAVAVGVVGVFAAPRGRRRRATTILGLVIAGAMVILGLALNVGRSIYLNAIPASKVTPAAAAGVFDPLIEPLRWTLRAVLVVGLAVAIVGYVTGPSPSAVAIRGWAARVAGRAHGRRTPTAVERWVGRYRLPLQLGALGVGALILVLWHYPTGTTVGWIAILTALVCLAVFVVGTPRAGSSTSST